MKKAEVDEFMELMKSFAPAKKAPDKKAPGKPKAKRRRRYKKPASDSQVERLQQALMAAGISPGKDDGYWGPRTAAAYNKLIENSKTYGFDKYLKPIQNVGRQRHKMRPQAALNTAIKIAMYIARKQAGARNTITLGSLEFPFTSLSNPKTFLNYLQNVTNTQGAISPKTGMEYLRELVIYVDHNERDLEMKTPGSVRTWKSQLYKLMTAMRSYKPPVVPGQKGTPKTKPAASGNVFLPSPLSTVEDIRKALENLPPLSVVSSPEIFKDTVLPGKPINVQVDRFLKRLHEIKRAILNNQRFLKPHVEKILNRVTRYIPPMISIRNQI